MNQDMAYVFGRSRILGQEDDGRGGSKCDSIVSMNLCTIASVEVFHCEHLDL